MGLFIHLRIIFLITIFQVNPFPITEFTNWFKKVSPTKYVVKNEAKRKSRDDKNRIKIKQCHSFYDHSSNEKRIISGTFKLKASERKLRNFTL